MFISCTRGSTAYQKLRANSITSPETLSNNNLPLNGGTIKNAHDYLHGVPITHYIRIRDYPWSWVRYNYISQRSPSIQSLMFLIDVALHRPVVSCPTPFSITQDYETPDLGLRCPCLSLII